MATPTENTFFPHPTFFPLFDDDDDLNLVSEKNYGWAEAKVKLSCFCGLYVKWLFMIPGVPGMVTPSSWTDLLEALLLLFMFIRDCFENHVNVLSDPAAKTICLLLTVLNHLVSILVSVALSNITVFLLILFSKGQTDGRLVCCFMFLCFVKVISQSPCAYTRA